MSFVLNNENFKRICIDIINLKVVEIHLIQYVLPSGEIEDDDVELEIVFQKSSCLLLSSASDGERVHIRREPWVDPYYEPISDENREFIQESGKWSLFLANDHPSFASVIGKRINNVEKIHNEFGVLAGLAIDFQEKTLCFCVYCDEGKIFWGKDDLKMMELGFKIQEC